MHFKCALSRYTSNLRNAYSRELALTLVLLGSSLQDSHRGNLHPCWSSHNCRGCRQLSIHPHPGTPKGLVKVKARRTDALETSQSVVAGGRATGSWAGALIFICTRDSKLVRNLVGKGFWGRAGSTVLALQM